MCDLYSRVQYFVGTVQIELGFCCRSHRLNIVYVKIAYVELNVRGGRRTGLVTFCVKLLSTTGY